MIKNYTPHALNIYKDGKKVSCFESLGQVRLSEKCTGVANTEGIPTVKKQYTNVEGLPSKRDGIILVVSKIVLDAFASRTDLRCPDTGPDSVVRDDEGRIIGVQRLQAA